MFVTTDDTDYTDFVLDAGRKITIQWLIIATGLHYIYRDGKGPFCDKKSKGRKETRRNDFGPPLSPRKVKGGIRINISETNV